ncbi:MULTISPECIES: phytoene/squalene synthase family protein [unclassified Haladaptatus]|uniref:phytoene/squalene synthase family protein n=1 Tax=unclassified Haladaptatus TaxID=2622732 RepID=UPI0023E77985|nr:MULTISPECIES: phytoene/squalene synthase family protein [unclassified Haladaptatus]
MVHRESLAKSKAIHRRTGKTFYYATKLLPKRIRHATYVLYAFFRIADEVVDSANDLSPAAQRERLETLRDEALGRKPTEEPVLLAFRDLCDEYDIPDEEVVAFVDAMLADIEKDRYETYEELEGYMRGSAAAVGRMMTCVMQPDEPERALPHATKLGEAFQLTNFLRDVGEDVVDRDRIYLPLSTLESFGVTEQQIEELEFTDGLEKAMSFELNRAEELYREGVAGIRYLPEDSQFAILLSAILYADHHRLIRAQGMDTLSKTPSISAARKLRLIAETRWAWLWNSDPEAVFEKVSVAGTTTSRPPEPTGTPTQAR